jgi:DnaJ-domain-containing protein 1
MIVDNDTLLELAYTHETLTLFVQLNRLERRAVRFTPEEFTHWLNEQMTVDEAWRRARNGNYYTVLGVPRDASADEIKKSYRRLARKYHPDLQVGDEEKLKTINAAYEVLRDPAQRRQYDQQCTSTS